VDDVPTESQQTQVFAHQSEIQMEGFRFLQPNQQVLCNIVALDDGRLRAENIRIQ
jgi:cold shock CspA family protein